MTRDDVINDLHVIINYFKENNENCYPMALSYAIKFLSERRIEVKEYKEEDFENDLPFYDDELPF